MNPRGQRIDIEHLTLRLGGRLILDDLCLSLDAAGPSSCTGLIGANGAGKSSLFKCITGIERRYQGRILIGGQPIDAMPPHVRTSLGISFLAQDSWLFWEMTAADNLLAIAELLGMSNHAAHARVAELVGEFKLGHVLDTKAKFLSGGEMRRLEICRTLLREPVLAIFDEPFSGLDPQTAHELMSLLTSLKNRGFAMIISDHQVGRIFSLCGHVILLDQGRMLVQGGPQAVRMDPAAHQTYLKD